MTAPTLVVTGSTGFVGSHVVRLAHESGYRVISIGREPEAPSNASAHVHRYIGADLAEAWPLDEPIDAVVHLAGLAAVGPSFTQPQRYIAVNSSIMTAMCESLLRSSPRARVIVVSSGSVYQSSGADHALDESATTFPGSPYAIAKLLIESQAQYYAHRGLDTVVARPFNHIGPGQGPGFLVPDLARSLGGLAPGSALAVGNLSTARDYTDVRDVAAAYLALAGAPSHRHRVYNVASGTSRTGEEILRSVAEALDVAVPPTTVDAARLRPGDPLRITGSAERLHREFGWSPQIDWTTSIREFVESL